MLRLALEEFKGPACVSNPFRITLSEAFTSDVHHMRVISFIF